MKKNMKNVLALGMALAMVSGTVAYANDAVVVELPAPLEVETTQEITAVSEEVEKEASADFIVSEGIVLDVTTSESGAVIVMTSNEEGGLRFAVSDTSIIVDRVTGAYITAQDITVDMVVAVVFPSTSPMGMSMPPFLGNVSVVVANADAGGFVVGSFDDNFLDEANQLVINIDEEMTVLADTGVSKIGVVADMVKGQNALVFYDVTTRSIPAQTTPSFVLILEKAEVAVDEYEGILEEAGVELIALRKTAEEMGYTVVWQGKDKPVLVEDDVTSMEIVIGDVVYRVDGEEKEAAAASTLVDGILFVSSDIFEWIILK